MHDVEPVHAGRRLLADALDAGRDAAVPAGIFLQPALDGGEEHFLFLVGGLVEEVDVAGLGPHAEMDEQGRVTAVVEDEVRAAAVAPFEDLVGVIPVIDEALALAREHRNAGGGDRRGGVVLRRIDIAGGPAQVSAQRPQSLDQHGGLHRHVQRTGDPRPGERLRGTIFGSRRHQPRHFRFGDVDLLAPQAASPRSVMAEWAIEWVMDTP